MSHLPQEIPSIKLPFLGLNLRKDRPVWIWFLWLALFYVTWAVIIVSGNHFETLRNHWAIAASMLLGSYVAGSTPMGGGTVGFPILVLLFDQPANLGRDFSFAIQSIGMTSASIFILVRRSPIASMVLLGSMAASLIGTPIGLFWIAPLVSEVLIKMIFAVLWASFGVLHLFKVHEFCGYTDMHSTSKRHAFTLGAITGLLASLTVSSISGVGIDMMVYALLVLFFRCDLKVAIPTSVVIMAFTSIVGLTFQVSRGAIAPGVFENWLAASPIVILGAPLGVFVVNRIGREITLVVVSVLCIFQFAWTCQHEWVHLGWTGFIQAIIAVILSVGILYGLYLLGRTPLDRRF